jgi:hypothetical protein
MGDQAIWIAEAGSDEDPMKRKNKSPYIQNFGEWSTFGWKTCGIFYESMKREKIYVSIETGETSSGANAPKPPRLLV